MGFSLATAIIAAFVGTYVVQALRARRSVGR